MAGGKPQVTDILCHRRPEMKMAKTGGGGKDEHAVVETSRDGGGGLPL